MKKKLILIPCLLLLNSCGVTNQGSTFKVRQENKSVLNENSDIFKNVLTINKPRINNNEFRVIDNSNFDPSVYDSSNTGLDSGYSIIKKNNLYGIYSFFKGQFLLEPTAKSISPIGDSYFGSRFIVKFNDSEMMIDLAGNTIYSTNSPETETYSDFSYFIYNDKLYSRISRKRKDNSSFLSEDMLYFSYNENYVLSKVTNPDSILLDIDKVGDTELLYGEKIQLSNSKIDKYITKVSNNVSTTYYLFNNVGDRYQLESTYVMDNNCLSSFVVGTNLVYQCYNEVVDTSKNYDIVVLDNNSATVKYLKYKITTFIVDLAKVKTKESNIQYLLLNPIRLNADYSMANIYQFNYDKAISLDNNIGSKQFIIDQDLKFYDDLSNFSFNNSIMLSNGYIYDTKALYDSRLNPVVIFNKYNNCTFVSEDELFLCTYVNNNTNLRKLYVINAKGEIFRTIDNYNGSYSRLGYKSYYLFSTTTGNIYYDLNSGKQVSVDSTFSSSINGIYYKASKGTNNVNVEFRSLDGGSKSMTFTNVSSSNNGLYSLNYFQRSNDFAQFQTFYVRTSSNSYKYVTVSNSKIGF